MSPWLLRLPRAPGRYHSPTKEAHSCLQISDHKASFVPFPRNPKPCSVSFLNLPSRALVPHLPPCCSPAAICQSWHQLRATLSTSNHVPPRGLLAPSDNPQTLPPGLRTPPYLLHSPHGQALELVITQNYRPGDPCAQAP